MKEIEKGNKVAEWMQGNVKVEVYDGAYAGKSKEEIDKVLERISETISKIAHAAANEEIDIGD
ncbi:hypothetical protein SAMN05660297_02777 [Natronincola peptidivorans]|uniref:Uncharacterized protein n=1 Tax=Natronincola peptidivorans TaxID=426128 RepID=A0A1I0FEG5_9FIRM|nr:hypothetical protein [Natronincola peptidivorans]SET56302.1 hypothetical protein SAMN05660297_02777 [Natronincola peptidivorans]